MDLEEVETLTRWSSAQLSAEGRRIGEIDGIPVRPNVGIHAVGTFSVKLDLESEGCRLAYEKGEECRCALSVTASDDVSRRNAIYTAGTLCPTLTVAAFDDYDTARRWSHP